MVAQLALLSGILKGVGAGRKRKQDLAAETSKTALIAAKAKLAKTENDLYQHYLDLAKIGQPQGPGSVEDVLSQQGDGGGGTKFGESFDALRQGSSVGPTDELGTAISQASGANEAPGQPTPGQPPGGDPNMLAAIIQGMSKGKLPLFDIAKLKQQKDLAEMREKGTQGRFNESEDRRQSTKDFRESELVSFEFKTPSGDVRKGTRLKNESPQAAMKRLNEASQREKVLQVTGGKPQAGAQGVGGDVGGTLLKSLREMNKPLSPSSRSGFIHKRTGAKLPSSIKTMQQALDNEFIAVNVGTITQQMELKSALAIVDKLDNFVKEIFADVKTPGDRITKALSKNLQVYFQFGESTKPGRYQRVKEAVLARIVRAFGERGTLTDQDIARARGLFPRLVPFPDRADFANDLMGDLRELIHEVNARSLETWTPPEGASVIGSDFDIKGFLSEGGGAAPGPAEGFSGDGGEEGTPLTAEELTKKLGL